MANVKVRRYTIVVCDNCILKNDLGCPGPDYCDAGQSPIPIPSEEDLNQRGIEIGDVSWDISEGGSAASVPTGE